MRSRINLGTSVMYVVDTYVIATGSSRRAVVRRLVSLALSAPRQPPLRHDRYLTHGTGRRGGEGAVVTMDEPDEWWDEVNERARFYGESRSESVRALVMGGTLLDQIPERQARAVERRALGIIQESGEIDFAALGKRLWPTRRPEWGGFNGTYAARIVCIRLREKGIVEFHEPKKGWRKTPL